jgi:signal peptidase I
MDMNDKPPYRNWVGVLLGFFLSGSAHFLSGERAAGLKWYFGIRLCAVLALLLIAIPGTTPYVLGIMLSVAFIVLWFVMLKQSYRPVRRIGFLGWIVVLSITVTLNSAMRLVFREFATPFKVPTGAMEPTISGIHVRDKLVGVADQPSIVNWLNNGERFMQVKASNSGILSAPTANQEKPNTMDYCVASQRYSLPRSARPRIQPGEKVSAGDILWSGIVTAGDHIYAEKLIYRFADPKRGDIIVFRTDGIQNLPPHTVYVMRLAGLPGEHIRIEPPNLIVNDHKITEPAIFRTIASQSDGYVGFQLAQGHGNVLSTPTNEVVLGADQYFVLGDNTRNSFDSRYWGPVPRKNIIGKVTRIYWPFSRINALEGK